VGLTEELLGGYTYSVKDLTRRLGGRFSPIRYDVQYLYQEFIFKGQNMTDENIKEVIIKYINDKNVTKPQLIPRSGRKAIDPQVKDFTNNEEFLGFFFPIYKGYLDRYKDHPMYQNSLLQENAKLIRYCKVLHERKHSKYFIETFIECYEDGYHDFNSDVCSVYYHFIEDKKSEMADKEAFADAKSDGLSDMAAKLYADEMVKYLSDHEFFSRKKAENYDYAYSKAINDNKSEYYAKTFAEKMSEFEVDIISSSYSLPDEKLCARYADKREKALAIK
jgi:hypothetical protein